MTRLEELTLNLADDAITDAECQELQMLLAGDSQAKLTHIRTLQIEAGLRLQRQGFDVVEPVMKSLRNAVADSVTRNVMTQIKTRPTPEWRQKKVSNQPSWIRWKMPVPSYAWRVRLLFTRAGLSIAVCLILAAACGVWYFNPTMGEPTLADVQGSGLILERAGQWIPASVGLRLQPGDVLRTPEHVTAKIGYAPENTRLKLLPGTELTLTARARGKLFELESGRLEATAARQSPFHPMIIATPQARAQIVGTRFTLLVTNNATRLDVAEGNVRFTRLSDKKLVQVSAGHFAVAAADYELTSLPFTGSILREYWTNLPSGHSSAYSYSPVSLFSNPKFPDHPDGWDYLAKFETRRNWSTNYGARICGHLLPPVSGDYTFWISAGHYGDLFLSSDDDPENRQQIAHAEDTHPREWNNWQGQQSAPITLKAGREYYIEALQMQGTDEDDYLAVAWQGPGRPPEVIPGKFLAPWQSPKRKERAR